MALTTKIWERKKEKTITKMNTLDFEAPGQTKFKLGEHFKEHIVMYSNSFRLLRFPFS